MNEYFCSECGALLNEQEGFSAENDFWYCLECGYSNRFENVEDEEDEDVDEVDEEDKEDDAEDDEDIDEANEEDNDEVDEDIDEAEEDIDEVAEDEEEIIKLPASEIIKLRRSLFFKGKKVQIGVAPADLKNRDVNYVHNLFYNKGFSKIKVIPVKDIYVDKPYKEGSVEKVFIGGSTSFKPDQLVAYDSEMTIIYHAKKEITMPFSAKSLIGFNYSYVIKTFSELGFTEIYTSTINDLIFGWLTKDGATENVSIAGNGKFKKKSVYKYDEQIIIKYHTFK